MRNKNAEQAAVVAAQYLTEQLQITKPDAGIILGTGWGDKLTLSDERSLPFNQVPGFGEQQSLEGHARKFVTGKCGNKTVVALSGRVHINEARRTLKFTKWSVCKQRCLCNSGFAN